MLRCSNDAGASGEQVKTSSPNTGMLPSAAPRSDIWGKVLAASFWLSQGSCVSLHLHWKINEKPFDFPFKESVHGGETLSYAKEKGGGGGGGHVNKTISCHYNSVWGSIFMLH